MIIIGGMIGLGKTSAAQILGEHFGAPVLYENVEDNKILPLFYTAGEEEILANRYPFLLQLWFLNAKFQLLIEAKEHSLAILDRSIYEDWYFAKKNMELGRISELEMEIYEGLLNSMLCEERKSKVKEQDLMVYLKGSFELVLERIGKRGREFELSDELREYYYVLWKDYEDWITKYYDPAHVVIIDAEHLDFVNREEDRKRFVQIVETAYHDMNYK